MITIIKQLFSRRSDQSLLQSSTQNNGLFTRWQSRFAHVLSRHEKRLSTRQKKIILLTYCFGFGLFFAALLLKPFLSPHTTSPVTGIQKSLPLLPLDTTVSISPDMLQQDSIIINSY